MKYIILLLALMSTTLLSTEIEEFTYKYDFNHDFHKWLPVGGITNVSYYLKPIINDTTITLTDDLYSVQAGLKYRFTEDTYILFKTEYATDYVPGNININFLHQEPILIFEFRFQY